MLLRLGHSLFVSSAPGAHTGLHHDDLHNLLFMIRGAKHLLLIPPAAKPHLYMDKMLEVYPPFTQVRPHKILISILLPTFHTFFPPPRTSSSSPCNLSTGNAPSRSTCRRLLRRARSENCSMGCGVECRLHLTSLAWLIPTLSGRHLVRLLVAVTVIVVVAAVAAAVAAVAEAAVVTALVMQMQRAHAEDFQTTGVLWGRYLKQVQ